LAIHTDGKWGADLEHSSGATGVAFCVVEGIAKRQRCGTPSLSAPSTRPCMPRPRR